MAARTDAARAEVVARRQLLLDEVVRLEAAGRSAIDIPAKIRRAPARAAALAVGTAFFALGGPKRTYRAVRRAVLGPDADLPKSMLPDQIEKALKALGDDGDRVRGLIEREFVDYLEKSKPVREARDLRGTISELGGNLLRPATAEAGKRLAKELFKPDGGSFNEAMNRIQARRDARKGEAGGSAGNAEAHEAAEPHLVRKPRGRKAR
ncbi:MAG: hypothetical protein ACHQ01_02115 [Candidatus Limnocylindrales bacterium]